MREPMAIGGLAATILRRMPALVVCCLMLPAVGLAQQTTVKPRPRGETPASVAPPPKVKLSGSLTVMVPQTLSRNGFARRIADAFAKEYDVRVQLMAREAGTGLAALRAGRAETALTDDEASEAAFVKAGHGLRRYDVMYTEMLLVGPGEDPAGIAGMISVIEALKAIARSRSPFVSRGDGSGVALAERRFWTELGIEPRPELLGWYRVSRADMHATLAEADRIGGYTITDYATWIAAGPYRSLKPVTRDDPRLQLRFGIVLAKGDGRPSLNMPAAIVFASWLTGEEGRKLIEGFEIAGETPYIADPAVDR